MKAYSRIFIFQFVNKNCWNETGIFGRKYINYIHNDNNLLQNHFSNIHTFTVTHVQDWNAQQYLSLPVYSRILLVAADF